MTGTEYLVLGCSRCRDYFITTAEKKRSEETLTCGRCGHVQASGKFARMAEHPEFEGAAELRARQLARDAGHGVEYHGVDDYGVLADQIDTQQTVVDPKPEAGWHPSFFATAAESTFEWADELYSNRVDDTPLGSEWLQEAAAEAAVEHPAEHVLEQRVDRHIKEWQDSQPETSETGSVSISLDRPLDPVVSISLSDDEDLLSPTALHQALFAGESALTTRLVDALQSCGVAHSSAYSLYEAGVTALDGAYARVAMAALEAGSALSADHPLWTFLSVTRSLGGQTQLGLPSSLEDIEMGPTALFAVADQTPLIEVRVDSSFFDAKSTRRKRVLRHLLRLTQGVEVRITGSRLALQKLIRIHSDQLPVAVTERAQQRLRSDSDTLTEQRAQAATAAVDEIGIENPVWQVLEVVADSQRDMQPYDHLYQMASVSESAVRKRVKILCDVDLVERTEVGGETQIRLTAVGQTALEKYPELRSNDHTPSVTTEGGNGPTPGSSGGRPIKQTEQSDRSTEQAETTAVNNPRNNNNSTVYPENRSHVGGKGTSSSTTTGSSDVSTKTLSLGEHHGVAAASQSGYISLVDRKILENDRDSRVPRWSYDSDRDEIVVSVDWSESIALIATRLSAALLSDLAFNQVLTHERLAETPDGQSLAGLAIDNPYVLRSAACIGWLRDIDTRADQFRDRLETAKRELLSMTSDLSDASGCINPEVASDLLKKAHGLMGTVLRLYDLLEVDVVREIQFPHGLPDPGQQTELVKFLGKASTISSRYGAYSGHRVLYEPDEDKREDLLSEPDVSSSDPDGTLFAPWVLSGSNLSNLRPRLQGIDEFLELQDDAEKFAPFRLTGDVGDGTQRTAIAEAATRVLSFKRGIKPDRQAISVLAAFVPDASTAGRAVMRLKEDTDDEEPESKHQKRRERRPRKLDFQDIRYGLSQLDPERILPDLGGKTVSKVLHALLDTQEWLSTADVARAAGCSTRTLSTEANSRIFAELESAGILSREDRGQGKATLWRLQLSFRRERYDREPCPWVLVDREPPTGNADWQLSNSLFEVMTTAADTHGVEYSVQFGSAEILAAFGGTPPIDREFGPLLSADPGLTPLLRALAILLNQTDRLETEQDPVSVSFGKHPDPEQSTLTAAVG